MEIPVWGIGVAAICGGVGLMIALMQLGEGLSRSLFLLAQRPDHERLIPPR